MMRIGEDSDNVKSSISRWHMLRMRQPGVRSILAPSCVKLFVPCFRGSGKPVLSVNRLDYYRASAFEKT